MVLGGGAGLYSNVCVYKLCLRVHSFIDKGLISFTTLLLLYPVSPTYIKYTYISNIKLWICSGFQCDSSLRPRANEARETEHFCNLRVRREEEIHICFAR